MVTAQPPRRLVTDGVQSGTERSLRFIGNATVLIRYAGLTLLTDPNFTPAGQRVPIGYGLTATRRIGPAATLDALPPIDAVILSHYHGDHFDPGVEQTLDPAIPIITTRHAAATLERKGFRRTVALDTWERTERRAGDGRVRITATPGQHAPGLLRHALPPVMGSVIEAWSGPTTDPSMRIYLSGDTLMFAGLREIGVRFPELDLALIHLGGTRVLGLTVTMDAEQGVDLMGAIAPRLTIPIHIDDYDRFTTTAAEFVAAVQRRGLDRRVRVLERGAIASLDPALTGT